MKWVVLVVLSLFSCMVWAAKPAALFQADIPVHTQAENERAAAIQQGLLEVLVRLSGDNTIGDQPAIKTQLKDAENSVEEFSYQPDSAATGFVLHVRYNAEAIKQLLASAKVTYSDENRPLILVWLVTETQQASPEMIGAENAPTVQAGMKAAAQKYGFPLLFPMLDMTDMSQVSVADITHFSLPKLQEAAKRYHAPALLVGTMVQENAVYKSQWQLALEDNTWRFSIEEQNINTIWLKLMSQVNGVLINQYTQQTSNDSEQQIVLGVTHITQRTDIARLVKYLKHLHGIKQVELAQVAGDYIELEIVWQGPAAAFYKRITLDGHLLSQPGNTGDKPVYQWIP